MTNSEELGDDVQDLPESFSWLISSQGKKPPKAVSQIQRADGTNPG